VNTSTSKNIPADIEKEKKKNIKLAISVAALGIFGFFCVYIFMFALVFLKPGILFSFIPFPEMFSKEYISLNDKLYVMSTTMDFEEISFADKTVPEEKVQIALLDGDTITPLDTTEPYDSLSHNDDKIFFFSQGHYRTFDGKKLEVTETNVIGSGPTGTVSPEGMWVLSKIRNRPILNLIKNREVVSFPLPDQFLSGHNTLYPPSARLLWFQENLYLYWTSGGQFFWSVFNGKEWSVTESSGYAGSTKAIADEQQIYLFNKKYHQHHHSLSYITFHGSAWSEPVDIALPGFILEWSPLILNDKLFLVVRSFFSEQMYTIEDGKAVNPVRTGGAIFGTDFITRIVQLILLINVLYFIFVFAVSVFIGKFKMRTWDTDSGEFEFATLFRRFAAKIIDSVIVMLLPSLIIIYLLINISSLADTFRLVIVMVIAAGYFIVGHFLYHSLLEGLYGATIGKKICGIQVLKDDFSRCGLLAGFLRNLMRIVDYLFYYLVAVVTMAGTLKWQRLGDIVAGTVVVRNKPRRKEGTSFTG
jgi:uncharacterized RDD family membrane protein YckC